MNGSISLIGFASFINILMIKFISLASQVYSNGKFPDIISKLSIGELRKAPVASHKALFRIGIRDFVLILLVNSYI